MLSVSDIRIRRKYGPCTYHGFWNKVMNELIDRLDMGLAWRIHTVLCLHRITPPIPINLHPDRTSIALAIETLISLCHCTKGVF
jgi:hypothetical protein